MTGQPGVTQESVTESVAESVAESVTESVTEELVVLLDEDGRPCGTAPKATVHSTRTPLHLAFSCWVLDDDGRVLITQRAAGKPTWPGIWTNTFCGHPAPGERVEDAVHRRAAHELGVGGLDLRCVLPDFRYRAVMTNGLWENEICPVHVARGDVTALDPHPAEVMDSHWLTLDELGGDLARRPDRYSPWMHLQWPLLLRSNAFQAG